MMKLKERFELRTPDGEVFRLDTGKDARILSDEGLGMPPIEYVTQRGPFQHGETVVDYYLRPRVVQLIARRNFCDRLSYWTGRASLLNALRPNRASTPTPLVLRKYLPDGTRRDLDVYIELGPKFEPPNGGRWDEFSYQETIRLVAYDPVFYNPTRRMQTISVETCSAEERPQIAATTHAGANSNSLTFTGHTVPNTDNRYMLVSVSIRGDVDVTGITRNGVAFNKIQSEQPSGDIRVEQWGLLNPSAGTHDVVVSLSGSQNISGTLITLTGVDQSSPIGGSNVSSTTTPSLSASVNVSSTPSQLVISQLAFQGGGDLDNLAVGSDQTLITNYSTNCFGANSYQNGAELVTASYSWSSPTDVWALAAVSFNCVGTSVGSIVFPVTFPISFGAFQFNTSLTYNGNWLDYPVIVIHGPISNPIIENITTGESLALEYDILAGEEATFDLRFGSKTVTLNDGTELLSHLTGASDIGTFHLAPHPIADGGINELSVYGTGATENTFIVIRWYDRYVGI